MASPFDCLLFDLDDTLYPSTTGLAQGLKKNIDEKFGLSETKASSLRVELFKTYGSTLAGLRALGYDIDADDYHGFVHGRLPYAMIKPDPQLRNLLRSITQRKIIFTNSDRVHAIKVLKRLGLEDCFDQIICFETLNPNLPKSTRPDEFPVVLKPSMDAMKIALDVSHVDPGRTLFFDDNVRNIAAGKALGLWTCLVGKTVKTKEADYAIETVNNLEQVIPEMWVNETDGGDERISRTSSELDAILAATTPVGA
ncbi:Haloacid dehalogenase-like hydrolase - like 8 [Theobroma cacao]|nr:Haloacid dehalogenase-like hydrolase - like 8 [Theobroma cacao]